MASEGNYPVIIITEIINFLFKLKMTSCEIGIFWFTLDFRKNIVNDKFILQLYIKSIFTQITVINRNNI